MAVTFQVESVTWQAARFLKARIKLFLPDAREHHFRSFQKVACGVDFRCSILLRFAFCDFYVRSKKLSTVFFCIGRSVVEGGQRKIPRGARDVLKVKDVVGAHLVNKSLAFYLNRLAATRSFRCLKVRGSRAKKRPGVGR